MIIIEIWIGMTLYVLLIDLVKKALSCNEVNGLIKEMLSKMKIGAYQNQSG